MEQPERARCAAFVCELRPGKTGRGADIGEFGSGGKACGLPRRPGSRQKGYVSVLASTRKGALYTGATRNPSRKWKLNLIESLNPDWDDLSSWLLDL